MSLDIVPANLLDGTSQEETEAAEASRRVLEWLEALDKDVFYALKNTRLVSTYSGVVLADAIHAKFPNTTTNVEQIQQLLDLVDLSSPVFAPLNIHRHGSLEFGSKWILFKEPQGGNYDVTKTPFDQLKKFATSSSSSLTVEVSNSSSNNKNLVPSGGDNDDPQQQPEPESPTSVMAADTTIEQQSNHQSEDPQDDGIVANKQQNVAIDDQDDAMMVQVLPTLELLLLCLRTLHA